MTLPPQYAANMVAFLSDSADFAVTSREASQVEVAPQEGEGTVRRYFKAHKVADAHTDIARDEPWAFLAVHPPVSKPELELPASVARSIEQLAGTDLSARTQRHRLPTRAVRR
jgi:hypothetical protein